MSVKSGDNVKLTQTNIRMDTEYKKTMNHFYLAIILNVECRAIRCDNWYTTVDGILLLTREQHT